MKTHHILLLMLLFPVLVFAQETPVCKIDGEVMPGWVCHSETSDDVALYSVGIGDSYNQAIIFECDGCKFKFIEREEWDFFKC